jgi:coniferyl-aldehyde dehydrogenase
MSILKNISTPILATSDDSGAIAELKSAFDAQRKAFAANRNPTLAERSERLHALIGMMMGNRERISAALSQDFGAHPVPAADLIETLGVVGRAQYVLEHLEAWMAPTARDTDAGLHGTAKAFVQYQPKGVVGNIVPWNFPFDLSVGPLTEMLAAGNRVIIKPSEFTPACGELLTEIVKSTFGADLVHVVNGGLDLAREFSATPWDHLLYTGSPNVGRQVMQAAAANLTPVTLELGGKCPAIMTPGSVDAKSVESVIGTKIIKNGQMCISVDYALVPRDEVETFVDEAKTFMAKSAPGYSRGDDCTGMISNRHLDRISDMLAEARDSQCRIVDLEDDDGEIDRTTRRMPMSLVVDPSPDLRIMQEEIFGPILPIVPYDDLDSAIASINAGERPLGLYVFGSDTAVTDKVLADTVSGGACVNTCAMQGALPSLGFGGSGMSGMGRHHGIAGFREFSNERGVVIRGEGDMISAFYAPYTTAAGLVQMVLSGS